MQSIIMIHWYNVPLAISGGVGSNSYADKAFTACFHVWKNLKISSAPPLPSPLFENHFASQNMIKKRKIWIIIPFLSWSKNSWLFFDKMIDPLQ